MPIHMETNMAHALNWHNYVHVHMYMRVCVCETAQTFYRLFLGVWTCSNCWDSSYSYTIRSWGQQPTSYCYSLCWGSNRSLPRTTKLAIPDLIVQNRSITLRSAPFHRQSVFNRRMNKSHSTHLIRYCRMQALQIYNWLNRSDNVQYTGLVQVLKCENSLDMPR